MLIKIQGAAQKREIEHVFSATAGVGDMLPPVL